MEISAIAIKDIMVREVISVYPETPLTEATKILTMHHFDGLPVVDHENTLVGILTEYDLISKGSAIHLPTFQLILKNLQIFKKDRELFASQAQELLSLTVKDVMNNDPLTLSQDSSFEEAVITFRDHHRVNPIPIIDKNRKVIGVISRFDILRPLQAFPS